MNLRIAFFAIIFCIWSFCQSELDPRSYIGCFNDDALDRDLKESMISSPFMTVNMCIKYCSSLNYKYSGLQYSSECYCGGYQYGKYGKANESQCVYKCKGNTSQACGGMNINSIYGNFEKTKTWPSEKNESIQGEIQQTNRITINSRKRTDNSYQFEVSEQHVEWLIKFSQNTFYPRNYKNAIVRLFTIKNTFLTIKAEYLQDSFAIQIEFRLNEISNKILIEVKEEYLPIENLIVEWKPPNLNFLINCKLIDGLTIKFFDYINALSLPFGDPRMLVTGEGEGLIDFYSIKKILRETGCIIDDVEKTTHLISTVATTPIPFDQYVNRLDLDSDFLLLTYNTRINQYENLLDLKKLSYDLSLLHTILESLTNINV